MRTEEMEYRFLARLGRRMRMKYHDPKRRERRHTLCRFGYSGAFESKR